MDVPIFNLVLRPIFILVFYNKDKFYYLEDLPLKMLLISKIEMMIKTWKKLIVISKISKMRMKTKCFSENGTI